MGLWLFRTVRLAGIPAAELGPAQGPFPATLLLAPAPAPSTPASPPPMRVEGMELDRTFDEEFRAAGEAAVPIAGRPGYSEGVRRIGQVLVNIVADVLRLGVARAVPVLGVPIAQRIRTPQLPAAAPAAEVLAPPIQRAAEPELAGGYAPRQEEAGYDAADLVVTEELGSTVGRGTVETVAGTRSFTYEDPYPELVIGG